MRLSERQKRYLALVDIPVWRLKPRQPGPAEPGYETAVSVPNPGPDPDPWSELKQSVAQCHKCPLHQTRKQTVFGVGNPSASWMFVGEAPGADEDRQGEPFVGRAGKLLTEMIAALGMQRSDVYIANILKCRPPQNRDPLPDEVMQCEPYLQQQIELVRPGIIIALGRVAAQNLLKTDERIGALRGRKFYYGIMETPLVVTYHPAYLLRSPHEKRKSWQDLLMARKLVAAEEQQLEDNADP